jgi:hypothetical protein
MPTLCRPPHAILVVVVFYKREDVLNMFQSQLTDGRAYAEEATVYCALADKALSKSDTLILNGFNCGLKV